MHKYTIHFGKNLSVLQIELQIQQEINLKRNQLPQEITAKSIFNTIEDTKKVIIIIIIIIFSIFGQIIQKMNIQAQTMNQKIQTTQTNQKTQTTNFPYTRSKKKILLR